MVFWAGCRYKRPVIKSELMDEAIRNANRVLEARFLAGDAEGMAKLYCDEAILLPPNAEPLSGNSSIAQFWRQVMSLGIKKFQIESLEIDPQGATVIEMGRYTLFGDDQFELDRGKYIVVWKLVKGEWKLHRDIWNSSLPGRR